MKNNNSRAGAVSIYTVAFGLFIATLVLFLGMYFFGMNTEYFSNSLLVNAFVMPAIYLVGAFISVNSYKKVTGPMGFREVFGRAFKPMFLGGIMSILFIFAFLNYADPAAKDLLNYQYIERQKSELDAEYKKAREFMKDPEEIKELDQNYEARKKSFAPELVKDKNMFSFRQFTYYFGAIMIFYVILSTFFASFFRSRTMI